MLGACEVEQGEKTLLNHIHADVIDRNIPGWGKGSLDSARMIHFALQIGKGTSLLKILTLNRGCGLCEQCHDYFCRNNYGVVRFYSSLPFLPSVHWHCSALSYCLSSKAEERETQRLKFLEGLMPGNFASLK